MAAPIDVNSGGVRDITKSYHNTLIGLFDYPDNPFRELKKHEISKFFIDHWMITDGGADIPAARFPNTFWRTDDDGLEIDFTDFTVFLITNKSPAHSTLIFPTTALKDYRIWHIGSNPNEKMTSQERRQLLEIITDAAMQWTPEQGRIHGGLNQILDVAAGVLNFCEKHPDDPNNKAHVIQINKLFSHIVNVVTGFNPDYDHFPTMNDVEFIDSDVSHFLDTKVPEIFKNVPDFPYGNACRQIAEWARKVKLEPWRKSTNQQIGEALRANRLEP